MTVTRWRPGSRLLLGVAAALLAVACMAPLWTTRMEAPQYRGEEALHVEVYAGRVAGDVQEVETLNQYIGVRLPLDAPELAALPWVLGAFLGLAMGATLLPSRWRRGGAAVLLALMLGASVTGVLVLQQRLYEMGHDRADAAFAGVPDFTPPVLGTARIANFTVHMGLGAGGWAYLVATLLVACAALWGHGPRRDTPVGIEADTRASLHAIREG